MQDKMTDDQELQDRFQYHPPSPEGIEVHAELTRVFASAAHLVNTLCPNGREKSLAVTKLEEGKFWASAAVARNPETR